jgi:hypothetical protein
MRVVERIPRHDGGQLSFAVAFSPALLDPQSETPAAVTGPNEKAAVRRYNVYRNNVTVSLIDALAAIFPGCLFRSAPRDQNRLLRISGCVDFRAEPK